MASLRVAASPRDPKVLQMWEAGLSDEEMAAVLDVTVRCIRADRVYLGLRRRPARAPNLADAELTRLYHELVAEGAHGQLGATLAQRIGLTHRATQERCWRLGLSLHVKGG